MLVSAELVEVDLLVFLVLYAVTDLLRSFAQLCHSVGIGFLFGACGADGAMRAFKAAV